MQLFGLAECFDVTTPFNGGYAIEVDFWRDQSNDQLYVVHQSGSQYGNDVNKTLFNEGVGTLSTGAMLRQPQNTVCRFPSIFKTNDGQDWMTGAIANAHGDTHLWYKSGSSWHKMPGTFLSEAAAPYDQLANTPVLQLPNGIWLAMPDTLTGGGVMTAMCNPTSSYNCDGYKSSGIIPSLAGGGAAQLVMAPDGEHVVAWIGFRGEPNRFHGAWYITLATCPWEDLMMDLSSDWTVHRNKFMIGKDQIHICDPAPFDGPKGGRVLVSHDQNALRLLSTHRALADIYRDVLNL